MDIQEFEQLWPIRDELDAEAVEALGKHRLSCPKCKAFAEGGHQVRQMLADLGEEKAPADFTYRMRVYAQNHLENKQPLLEHPWLRRGMMVTGVATGVLVMVLSVGIWGTRDGQPDTVAPGSVMTGTPDSEAVSPPTEEKTARGGSPTQLAAEDSDSVVSKDDSTARDASGHPQWNPQTVSTQP